MKKLLILLFSILFFSSLSVFADNYIPTIEKIFKEKVPKLNSGERFYGCIYQIEWGDEDLFKQKRELSYVKIGNSNRYAELNVRDFNELFEGDEGVPNIGDCFAFTSIYHMGKLSPNRYFGSLVEIYYGEYKIDNNASVKELKNQITVDEYFQDNISYDTKVITLIGEVDYTYVAISNDFVIILVSKKGKLIDAFLPPHKWENNELMRDKLRSISMGDIIKLQGHFVFEMDFYNFKILKIIE